MLVQIKWSSLFVSLFSKSLVGQEPMLVQIKWSRLFTSLFSEIVGRSKTNACPY
jgi:hypothetical protein